MVLWLLVFASDASINFLSGRFYDARDERRIRAALLYGAALDAVIGVNAIGFSIDRWSMLIPGVLGGAVGTLASMRRRKRERSDESGLGPRRISAAASTKLHVCD